MAKDLEPKSGISARKGPRDRQEREARGDAAYKKHLISPVDRTFVMVMGAIIVLFATIVLGASWLGL